MNPPDIRTGMGFDVHRLLPGEGLWLCGVFIACPYRLEGHSDADVGLHALCDALFGACAAGDIGLHFPPTDPQWKGKASKHFVEHAVSIVHKKGGYILNADITIIGEHPKIFPHRERMCTTLTALLNIPPDRVNIKATTTEKLGFTGREEGLAAQAVTTLFFEHPHG